MIIARACWWMMVHWMKEKPPSKRKIDTENVGYLLIIEFDAVAGLLMLNPAFRSNGHSLFLCAEN